MLDKKLINDFLIVLYKRHVKHNGVTISKLDSNPFHIVDTSFSAEVPSIIKRKGTDAIQYKTGELAKELQARGFVTINSLDFYLTKEGFLEAEKLIHPLSHFIKNHWKWYVPVIFGFISALVAIIRLTKIP